MPNDRVGIGNQPTSFGQARAQQGLDIGFDMRRMNHWLDNVGDKFDDIADEISASAAANVKEEQDKGFWGSLFTFGTTLGCLALDLGGAGVCTAAGLVAGGVTRGVTDFVGKAEETIPDAPTRADLPEQPDAKYYRDVWAEKEEKIDDISSDLGGHIQDIKDFEANAWKVDLLKQVKDSWNSFRVGYSATESGLIDNNMRTWQYDMPIFGEGELFAGDALTSPTIMSPDNMYNIESIDIPSFQDSLDYDLGPVPGSNNIALGSSLNRSLGSSLIGDYS